LSVTLPADLVEAEAMTLASLKLFAIVSNVAGP
jgi:hypothetical protein